jgi:lipopolysaccharide transport system permease protein
MTITNRGTSDRTGGPAGQAGVGVAADRATATTAGETASSPQLDWSGFDEIIEPRLGWRAVDFVELYRNRDVFVYWTLRNLKARHAQSALGIAWAIIQPLVNTAIFTIVFGRLVGVPSDGAPYSLFALVGMVVWTYFSNALRDSVESLTRYTNMLSKIYFPRLILPLSAVLGKLLDLAVGAVLVVPALFWNGVVPRPEAIVAVPALVLLLVVATMGLTLWLSALAVQYRDVAYALVFALQALMYVSPVVFSDKVVPERFRLLYGLNPVAGVIAGTRAVLLNTGSLPWDLIIPGTLSAVVLAVSGLYYFRRRERIFADVA